MEWGGSRVPSAGVMVGVEEWRTWGQGAGGRAAAEPCGGAV